MSEFVKVSKSSVVTNRDKSIKVEIFKFQKKGTKRFFFAPEYKSARITRIMFGRLWEAEALAEKFINSKK